MAPFNFNSLVWFCMIYLHCIIICWFLISSWYPTFRYYTCRSWEPHQVLDFSCGVQDISWGQQLQTCAVGMYIDPPKFELPLWTQWVLLGLLVASQTKGTKLNSCAVRCMNLELKTRAGEIQSDGCWSCVCRSHHFRMLTRTLGAPLPPDDL